MATVNRFASNRKQDLSLTAQTPPKPTPSKPPSKLPGKTPSQRTKKPAPPPTTWRDTLSSLGAWLLTHGPLYVAAAGLFSVYALGWKATLPGAFAAGMIAVTFCSEFLKPRLGELLCDARSKLEWGLLGGAVAACVGLGALGGVVALQAANGPRAAYDEAKGERDRAQSKVDAATDRRQQAQQALNALACTPDMPRSRCLAMTAENAPLKPQREQALAEAKADVDDAKGALQREQRDLDAISDPGPGIPEVGIAAKALIVGGIEFVLFAVPFANRRREKALEREREAAKQREAGAVVVELPVKEPVKGVVEGPVKVALKVNDGGWAKRRARYGQSGRRSRRKLATNASEAACPA